MIVAATARTSETTISPFTRPAPPAASRAAALRARLPAWYSARASAESTSPSVGVFGADLLPAGGLDPVAVAEQRDDRPGLHLADPGQRAISRRSRSFASAASVQIRDASPP